MLNYRSGAVFPFSDHFESDLRKAFHELARSNATKEDAHSGVKPGTRGFAAAHWSLYMFRTLHLSTLREPTPVEMERARPGVDKYTPDAAEQKKLASLMIALVEQFQKSQSTSPAAMRDLHSLAEMTLHWCDDGTGQPEAISECLDQLVRYLDLVQISQGLHETLE